MQTIHQQKDKKLDNAVVRRIKKKPQKRAPDSQGAKSDGRRPYFLETSLYI